MLSDNIMKICPFIEKYKDILIQGTPFPTQTSYSTNIHNMQALKLKICALT